jgi:hypothetical protein
MIRSRLGLKALAMCALVLGLMAVWAGAAQAEEPGGSWTYIQPNEPKLLKIFEGVLAEPEISGEIEKDGAGVPIPIVLHAEALEGTKVLYECDAFSVAAGSKLKPNGIVLGRLTFTSCKTLLNGVLSEACKPKEGKVTTNLIKAQMLLHKLAGGTIDKILIAEGETEAGGAANFATIESSAGCSLGIKVPVGGKFAIQGTGVPPESNTEPSEHLVKHLIKEFLPLSAIWILSNTPEHKSEILGGAWVFLTGAHTGIKWAGLWK